MTEPLRAGPASEPHQVSDPAYALGGALQSLSTSLWSHYAHELVERALSGHTYRMLQAHPLYLLTVCEFHAGILTGQPNPDRFFLPALWEELDRADVPPSAVHPSLNYGPAPSVQPPKG
jgi:hypothetical protein